MPDLTYDLHLHSCLSPCGSDDMTPGNIVGMAAVIGLDVIALTDHNTCKNCAAALHFGQQLGITVICGMELCTAEEVHVLCYFSNLSDAMAFDTYVAAHLPFMQNNTAIFGNQILCDTTDAPCGQLDNLLINATDISFGALPALMETYSGIMVPAHIDKKANSLISNLGFIPPESTFHLVEFAKEASVHTYQEQYPYLKHCHTLTSSDAHYLNDISEPIHTIHASEKSAEAVFQTLLQSQTT